MNTKCSHEILVITAVGIVAASSAHAEFTVVTGSANANQWFQSVGAYTAITFTGLPDETPITEQYASLGVHFTDSDGDWIQHAPTGYTQDGWGLNGWVSVELQFDASMRGFAAHYPGFSAFSFYSGSQLLYSRTNLYHSGVNGFAGFTSDVGFDRVILFGAPPDHLGIPDDVFYDNIYFSTVPAPSGTVLLIAAMFGAGRRSRASGERLKHLAFGVQA